MLNRFATMSALLAAAFMFTTVSVAADDAETKDTKDKDAKLTIKCPVSGAKINKEQSASYKEGKVFFCCKNCKAAFVENPAKHTVKANAQLVQTKQYGQKACPMSGGPMKTQSKIAHVTVKFCCGKCKKAADGAEGDDQLAMVFGDKAFEKAYAKKKSKKEKKEDS